MSDKSIVAAESHSAAELECRYAYQPIVDFEQRSVFGYEVLLRSTTGESASALAQRLGSAAFAQLDRLNRRKAFAEACELGLKRKLFLNCRAEDLLTGQGKAEVGLIEDAIEWGVSVNELVFELSEVDVVSNMTEIEGALDSLRAAGALIALDNFGAGTAGWRSLVKVNPDILKLDQTLIRDIAVDGPKQAAVRAIVGLSRELGIFLLAEDVEQQSEVDCLWAQGVRFFQGNYFAAPQTSRLVSGSDIFATMERTSQRRYL